MVGLSRVVDLTPPFWRCCFPILLCCGAAFPSWVVPLAHPSAWVLLSPPPPRGGTAFLPPPPLVGAAVLSFFGMKCNEMEQKHLKKN